MIHDTPRAAVLSLYGLVAFGQIRLQKIDGYRHVAGLLEAMDVAA